MSNLTTSFLLLAIALVLLYLAVTDRLSRVLDAWDVVAGKATVNQSGAGAVSGSPVVFNLPSLPALPKIGGTAA